MKKTFFLLNAFLWLSLLGMGCQGSSNAVPGGGSEDFSEPSSLSSSDRGGYSTADEAPGFGLLTMNQFTSDAPFGDPSVSAEAEAKAEADPDAQVYWIRIVWGNLELNGRGEAAGEEGTDVLPWEGQLSYDGNATLLLKRTILFEGNDSIFDEEDPLLIAWKSVTGPHIDGFLAKLIVVPGSGTDTLTFETKTLSFSVGLADLDRYNEIQTIDEDGHGVAMIALRPDADGCEKGFLEGKWHPRPEGEGGIFRGRVLTEEGDLNGHIRGHFGVRDGNPVLFGKYIQADGRFRGFLHGTYGDGAFTGDWTAAGGTLLGDLSGKYVTGETVDSGFFQGFWQESCE